MKRACFLLFLLIACCFGYSQTPEQIEAVKEYYNTFKGYRMKHFPFDELNTKYKVSIPGIDTLSEGDVKAAAAESIRKDPAIKLGGTRNGHQYLRITDSVKFTELPNPTQWKIKIAMEEVILYLKNGESVNMLEQTAYYEIDPAQNINPQGDFLFNVPDSVDLKEVDSLFLNAEYFFSAPYQYDALVMSKKDIGKMKMLKNHKITLKTMEKDSVIYKIEAPGRPDDPNIILTNADNQAFSRISSSKRIGYLHDFFEKKGYDKLKDRHLKKLARRFNPSDENFYRYYYKVVTVSGEPEKISFYYPGKRMKFWLDKRYNLKVTF